MVVSTNANPWVQSPDCDERSERHDAATVVRAPPLLPSLEPQAASVSAPRRTLQRRSVDLAAHVSVWWVGVHGGAGESTLEQLLEGSRANGHAWPDAEQGTTPPPVILVARTHAHGLRQAQLAATEWASGNVAVQLHGLVLVADAPRRLPKPLRDFAHVVGGGVPQVWRVPWVEAWRRGEPVSPQTAPKALTDVLAELRSSLVTPTAIPRP